MYRFVLVATQNYQYFNVSAWIFEARQTPYSIFLHFVELTVYKVQYSYHFDLARSINISP